MRAFAIGNAAPKPGFKIEESISQPSLKTD